MKVNAVLKAEGDLLGALRGFLGKLLKEGVVDYLLVPQEIPITTCREKET